MTNATHETKTDGRRPRTRFIDPHDLRDDLNPRLVEGVQVTLRLNGRLVSGVVRTVYRKKHSEKTLPFAGVASVAMGDRIVRRSFHHREVMEIHDGLNTVSERKREAGSRQARGDR